MPSCLFQALAPSQYAERQNPDTNSGSRYLNELVVEVSPTHRSGSNAFVEFSRNLKESGLLRKFPRWADLRWQRNRVRFRGFPTV